MSDMKEPLRITPASGPGYRAGRLWRARGLAAGAVRPAAGFTLHAPELAEISAGRFAGDAASGHVLSKRGFAYTTDVKRYSQAHGCDVARRMMNLPRARFARDEAGKGGSGHGG